MRIFKLKIDHGREIPFGFSYSSLCGRTKVYFKLPLWVKVKDQYEPDADEIVFGRYIKAVLVSFSFAHGDQLAKNQTCLGEKRNSHA